MIDLVYIQYDDGYRSRVLFSYTPTYDYGWKVKVTDKFYAKVLR